MPRILANPKTWRRHFSELVEHATTGQEEGFRVYGRMELVGDYAWETDTELGTELSVPVPTPAPIKAGISIKRGMDRDVDGTFSLFVIVETIHQPTTPKNEGESHDPDTVRQ